MRHPILSAGLSSVLLFSACILDRKAGKSFRAVTRLTSTNLMPLAKTGAMNCPQGNLCVTPGNLEGRVHTGGLMVGGNGPDMPGYRISLVGASEDALRRPDSGRGGIHTFNLGQATELDGKYYCCDGGSPYPSDSQAVVRRLEFEFDYLDFTFTVPGGPLAGNSYTVRAVYVDEARVDDTPMGPGALILAGEKLLRREGEPVFRWCSAEGCEHEARPEAPLKGKVDVGPGPQGQGNPHYHSLGIELVESTTFTQGEAERGDWRFTVDFHMEGSARFLAESWAALATEADLVAAFQLYDRGNGGPDSPGVKVNLSKAGLPD